MKILILILLILAGCNADTVEQSEYTISDLEIGEEKADSDEYTLSDLKIGNQQSVRGEKNE